MRNTKPLILLAFLAAVMLSGCVAGGLSENELFPAQVGSYFRTNGPVVEATTGVDVASYQGPEGAIKLWVRQVSRGQAKAAVDGLPAMASNVGYDPALGVREGVFFYYAGEFNAAWSNGDWVFVISADSDTARRAFLAGYGF